MTRFRGIFLRTVIPTALVLTMVSTPLTAREYSIEINPIEYLNEEFQSGVQIRPGLFENEALALGDQEYVPDSRTELLLNFNREPAYELMEANQGYSVESSAVSIRSDRKYRGSGSAMFIPGAGLKLRGSENGLFGPEQVWTDFSMEFWMYPAHFQNGQELFAWTGTSWISGRPVRQELSIRSRDGKMLWDLENFFINLSEDEEFDAVLRHHSARLMSRSEIVPRSWSHHMLRYDSGTGVLEYLVNGVSEAVMHLSSRDGAMGSPLLPYVGKDSTGAVEIGGNYHGFLDDFRISRNWVERPSLEVARNEPGYAVIGPIDLGYDAVRLTSFQPMYRTPGNTEIRYSILQRDAANPVLGSEAADPSQWSLLRPGDNPSSVLDDSFGRHVYLRLDFLPDGSADNIPLVQNISLQYEQDPAPPAPVNLRTFSGDSHVELAWNDVVSGNVRGYLLYYGDSPGSYFGEDSSLGPSPVDLGNVTEVQVDGLLNGKMYYFRIASYNRYNSPEIGLYRERNLSQEVFARPSRDFR